MPLNPERLRILRQFEMMTQAELGERVAVSQPTIADYEAGRKEPQPVVAEAMASVLRVRTPFLYESDSDVFVEEEYNFRRRTTTSEKLRRKVIAQASLFGIFVRAIQRHVPNLPKLNIPSFPVETLYDVEQSAENARVYWGLGTDVPIDNMVHLLESAGVVVTVADAETAAKVDAFSRYGATSVVVLNTAKGSTSRTFFDAAHEAGHGVLHHGQPPKPWEVREEEAQLFAGAFLLPRKALMREFWSKAKINWTNLLDIKARWGVSLAAILMRAYTVGLIDAAVYRTAFHELSRRGWRTAEPEEPTPEIPQLFTLALNQYQKNTRQSLMALIDENHVSADLFADVCGVAPYTPGIRPEVVSLADRRSSRRLEN